MRLSFEAEKYDYKFAEAPARWLVFWSGVCDLPAGVGKAISRQSNNSYKEQSNGKGKGFKILE
jgi:hypothetical protein